MDVDPGLKLECSERQLIERLLENSTDLPLDILETDPYPEDLTLALFSQIVYTPKGWLELDADYREKLDLPLDWCLLATGSNSGTTNGYFGAAFFHGRLQQIVVAHRGTLLSNTGALITDALGIYANQYTSCVNSALTFTEQIRNIILSVNTQYGGCYNLAITGHSLGGWLAQITAFTVKWFNVSGGKLMKNSSGGVHAKTVVFDSPGAKAMLDKILDDYYDRFTTNFLDRLNITVFVSAPNIINTCGMHVGTVNRVKIDVSKFDRIDKETPLYTLKTHAIDNFVNVFRNKSDINEVKDWPKNRAELKSLFGKEALNHDNCYDKDFEKLTGELHLHIKRYKAGPSGDQSDEGMMVKSCLNAFSETELHILNDLKFIQKQAGVRLFNEFVLGKNLQMRSENLFPDFEINLSSQTIICKSKKLLKDLTKRVKQLMRWLGPEFTALVKKEIEDLHLAFDSFYRAEGQSFLQSLPKSSLKFNDSFHLRDFLLSDTARVLSLVTQDGAFEIIRLLNVFSQIKESIDSSHQINKYINDSNYTVVDWPRLHKLLQIGSPIHQNNLMIIDGTSPSTDLQLCSFFNNYKGQNPPNNLKKLVYISSSAIDVFNSFENIYVQKFIAERQINLQDFSNESQKCVFNRKFISLGNKMFSFRDLLEERCSIPNINEFLSSDHFRKIAINEEHVYITKDTRPMTGDLQMPFITINITTSKENVLNCSTKSLVVICGLNRGDLEIGAAWERLNGKIILAEGDVELFFKDTCNNNQDKTIYLFEVSGDAGADVRCIRIFNRSLYVTRKFKHRMSINLKYFTEGIHADNMFVVCSEEQKISLLGMIDECAGKALENVLLVATKEQEEDIIQNYTYKNIHFVNLGERGVLEWRFSHGSVERLGFYVSTESFEPIDELTLSLTERKLVIITDEPGMGKTTSLASLSRHIESAWVIHIEVKQFKAHIDRLPDQLNPQNVAGFILSECCTGAEGVLARGLLENVIQSKTGSRRVVLMFDGFDEMDDYNRDKESSKDKLVKVFAFLQNKPSIQIFLTSRKYLKELLETKLSQFSTSFVTINLQEQQDFLFKFWGSFLPIELGINLEGFETRLEKYAAEVLRQAKLVLGSDMECFMGIPLQLRMLAEVFRPQSDLLIQPLEELFKKITIVSAPNLYKKFVNLKYEIYLHDKTLKGRALDEDEILEYTESLNKDHGELGFKTFFSDFYNYLILNNYCKAPTDQKLVKLNRVGLIQSLGNGEFRFIHRTYAEFCCARMVVRWINQPNITFKDQLIENVLLPQILLHPDSRVIRLFMNVELCETPLFNTQRIISKLWLEDSPVFRDNDHQTALHIAVQEQNEHIVAFLVNGLSPLRESSPEDYVSFFAQQDLNCRTALDRVDGLNSFNIESNSSSYRIVKNILQSMETCSPAIKEMFIFGFLFKFKPGISNYFQESESSNFSRASERIKEVNLLIKPFIDAVRDNDVNVVKEILSEQLHNAIERYCILLWNDKDDIESKTILHLAAKWGRLDVVRQLAKQTSVPLFNVLMARSYPLISAAKRGHLDIVKFFKERGADINIRSKRGKTALMDAARNGHILTIEFLVKNGADIKSTDNSGYTVLHSAVQSGNLSITEYLVKNGADVKSTNNDGVTVLHCAVLGGNLSIIEYLVKNGADIKSTSNDGVTVLHSAVLGGNLSIIEYLVKNGADIKSTNNNGVTVLHKAVSGGNLSIVEYLVKNGADIKSTDNSGTTVLLSAVRGCDLSIMEYLVKNGADIKSTDNDGCTVLHDAVSGDNLSIIEYLVKNGVDIKSTSNDGVTVLHSAVWGGNLSIVEYLVKNGADIKSTGNGGLTVLHSAVSGGNRSIVEYLVKNGADIKSTSNDGETVLHYAVLESNLSCVKYLVEHSADINTTNKSGDTLLHTAALQDDLTIVDYLLQLGVNPDRLNNKFRTALTVASQWEFWDAMQALLNGGADVNADGGLALRYAIEGGEWSIVKSLVDKQASVQESIIEENLCEFKNRFPNYEFRAE